MLQVPLLQGQHVLQGTPCTQVYLSEKGAHARMCAASMLCTLFVLVRLVGLPQHSCMPLQHVLHLTCCGLSCVVAEL
jgi:hypothetical protein